MAFILLLIFFLTLLEVNGQNFSPSYSWRCKQEEKCVRELMINVTINPTQPSYDSQDMCRLVCGYFGALWPQPTIKTRIGKNLVKISPSKIKFDYNSPSSISKDYLRIVSDLFLKNLMKECSDTCIGNTETRHVSIVVNVSQSNTQLTWTTNESYTLSVLDTENLVNVIIMAETVFGARNALETLTQLTAISNEPLSTITNILYIVTPVLIVDSPIYPHRGLMIDTARNFIPIKDIERTLDGMAASKLNVFHWHATDSQSFPLAMPRVPQLTRYGAYSKKEIYSQDDVRHIIDYALYRGIRVIIELDMPSHSGNGWQWGSKYQLGDLAVCVNQQPWRNYCIQPPCGQLNPINSHLYVVLKDIFKDLLNVLPPGETLHMGGDEVFINCWNSTPAIVEFLKYHGQGLETSDYLNLWGLFHSTLQQLWNEVKQMNNQEIVNFENKIILWSSQLTNPDVIEKYLPNDKYIIQTWVPTTDNLPTTLLNKGYKLIISTKNAWYFDHGFWGITTYYQWTTVYKNRIGRHKNILGGEACVWTERIDGNSLDSRTWPRAAAVAERLWSDPGTNTNIVESRFYRHRKRLIARGLRPEEIAPKYCQQNEGECF